MWVATLSSHFHAATHYNTLCNTLHHTATDCNTLRHDCNTLQHAATRCNTLQHTAILHSSRGSDVDVAVCSSVLQRVVACCSRVAVGQTWLYQSLNHSSLNSRCNTLQHAPHLHHWSLDSHCNTMQHAATRYNTLQHAPQLHHWSLDSSRNTLQHAATRCNTHLSCITGLTI